MDTTDTIIVGGGVAGLSAALWLTRAGKSFVLLEGQERLGGRVATNPERPDLDMGAAYFGPLQSYTMRFCDMLGIARIDNQLPHGLDHRTQFADDYIYKYQNLSFDVPAGERDGMLGQLLTRFGALGSLQFYAAEKEESAHAREELFAKIATLEALTFRVRNNLHAPWDDPTLAVFDQQSVQDWMDENLQAPTVKDLLSIGVRAALSAEPAEISMLYLLYYVATGGSFVNVMAVGGGADSYRFLDGASSLPRGLADMITKAVEEGRLGSAIVRDARVTRLEPSGDGVVATTKRGAFTGKRCIVALSPTLRAKIEIPGIDRARLDLCEKMRMGRTIKAFVTFKFPWWRKQGSSGYTLSAHAGGPIVWTMDNTWPGYEVPERFSLMAFIVGEHADELETLLPEERKRKILEHIARLFELPGSTDEARLAELCQYLSPEDPYREAVWGKGSSWSGGCPAAFFPPRTFCEYGRYLRAPFGPIHWAGAETATDWVGGYMNGAIQSGIRAAEEVLGELSRQGL